jgi:hypothetical protein
MAEFSLGFMMRFGGGILCKGGLKEQRQFIGADLLGAKVLRMSHRLVR